MNSYGSDHQTARREFQTRCGELSIPVWLCDSHGSVVSEPVIDLPIDLKTPESHATIQDAARSMVVRRESSLGKNRPMQFHMPPAGVLLGFIAEDASCNCTGIAVALLRNETAQSALSMDSTAAMLNWMHSDLHDRSRDRTTLNQFSDRLAQAYEEINMLFRIARLLNCVADPLQLMEMICHQLQQTLPFTWVALRFGASAHAVPDLADRLLVAGELPVNRALFDREASRLLAGWKKDDWTRLLTPAQSALADLMQSEIIADPITHDEFVVGALLAGNKRNDDRDLSSAETQFVDALAEFLGVFHENMARFAEQQSLFMGTLRALTASIDAKDHYTRGHSERVALVASLLAQSMGMEKSIVQQYHIAGLVHDVGKIGVPEAVLCKPARLTPGEFDLIKRHPRIGFDILKDIPMLAPMLPAVLHHHERWDGAGYPDGLRGQEIPLIARVLAMADAFDAMSSNRAYRPALTRTQVIAEVQRCSGTQFDPMIVARFMTLDLEVFDSMLDKHQKQSRLAA